MPQWNIYINEELAKEAEKLQKQLKIENRSELIRMALRELIGLCRQPAEKKKKS